MCLKEKWKQTSIPEARIEPNNTQRRRGKLSEKQKWNAKLHGKIHSKLVCLQVRASRFVVRCYQTYSDSVFAYVLKCVCVSRCEKDFHWPKTTLFPHYIPKSCTAAKHIWNFKMRRCSRLSGGAEELPQRGCTAPCSWHFHSSISTKHPPGKSLCVPAGQNLVIHKQQQTASCSGKHWTALSKSAHLPTSYHAIKTGNVTAIKTHAFSKKPHLTHHVRIKSMW